MIVFCGYANRDVVARVPELPDAATRVQASRIEVVDGGMAANAAAAAGRYGAVGVAFAGVVGSDPASRDFLRRLVEAGVDVGWTDTDGRLTTAVVLVTADGERAIVSEDDGVGTDHLHSVVCRLTRAGGGVLALDGYRFGGVPAATVPPLPQDIDLVVDLDGCPDRRGAEDALRLASSVVVGRSLFRELFGDTPPTRPARAYSTDVVVTAGADGWQYAGADGQTDSGRAHPVAVRDATGAGDCFFGVYVTERAAGTAAPGAARIAAAAAALSCTAIGARGNLPTRAETTALLSAAPAEEGLTCS